MAKAKKRTKPAKRKTNKAKIRKVRPKKVIVDIKKLMALEEAIKYVVEVSGDKGLEVFNYLLKRGTMEENSLARAMKFEKANSIRKFLYKLYNKNLVSYVKKKRGKKAWYTYYWTANAERLIFLLKKQYEDEIAQTKQSITLNKVNDFYICNTCNRRYDVTKALENDYKCANCGSILQHLDINSVLSDKQNRISFLNEKIKRLFGLVKYK